MRKNLIVPCLWFDDQAEAAASFYVNAFRDGRVAMTSHYPSSGDNPSGKPPGSVLTVELEILGQRFTALNGGPQFKINPTISFFATVASAAEADRLFGALSPGGQVMMELGTYPWSERYGWIQDRFGVSWQVMTAPDGAEPPRIFPCLMFAGAVHGRAEEALKAYAGIFPDSKIEDLARYAKGEGPEGTVKHGRVRVGQQRLVGMDSHVHHGASFDEAVSLQVMCANQGEIDRYWEALSEGGSPGPCGWLKDRFGVSWQVVPEQIAEWMSSTDTAANDRAFAAVMDMTKLDLAAIQRAFGGQ